MEIRATESKREYAESLLLRNRSRKAHKVLHWFIQFIDEGAINRFTKKQFYNALDEDFKKQAKLSYFNKLMQHKLILRQSPYSDKAMYHYFSLSEKFIIFLHTNVEKIRKMKLEFG